MIRIRSGQDPVRPGSGPDDVSMTSSGRYDVIMSSSGSGQHSGRIGSNFVSADDVSMTSAKRLPDRDVPVGTAARVSVTRRRLSCAWRGVRPPSATCHPSIFSFRRVDSKYAIIFNFHRIKNVETGQKPLGKINKKRFLHVLILIYGKI